jgi:hypothetical protein
MACRWLPVRLLVRERTDSYNKQYYVKKPFHGQLNSLCNVSVSFSLYAGSRLQITYPHEKVIFCLNVFECESSSDSDVNIYVTLKM